MMTRKGWSNLLSDIMKTGGMTSEMESLTFRLKDELEEREGMLKRYGEKYDGENEEKDEYDYVGRNDEEWKRKYDELAARYRNRLFGRSTNDNTVLAMGDIEYVKTVNPNNQRTIEEILF